MKTRPILITGGSGLIGGILMGGLKEEYDLYGLDIAPRPNDGILEVDISNLAQLEDVIAGLPPLHCMVHLAGDPRVEAPWESVLSNNIIGTRNVYEAAKKFDIPRVVFASSNHVTGGYEGIPPTLHLNPDPPVISTSDPLKPDSYYGVSKVFGEAIARYYYEAYGIESVCLRIGSVLADDDPSQDPRLRRTWLSHGDLIQLVRLSITAMVPFGIYYGVSDNKGTFWDIANARNELGYNPQDDASSC